MKNLIFILLILLFTGCKKQLVDLGLIPIEKENLAKTRGIIWHTTSPRDNIHVYYDDEIKVSREEIADDVDDAYRDILEALNIEHSDTITLFLFSEVEKINKLTGIKEDIISYPDKNLILKEVKKSKEDNYEVALGLILTVKQWGYTHEWLHKGFSKYASVLDETDGTLYPEAREILNQKAITLSTLTTEYSTLDYKDASVLAGSFVEYLVREKGMVFIIALWRTELDLTSKKLEEWEHDWKQEVLK